MRNMLQKKSVVLGAAVMIIICGMAWFGGLTGGAFQAPPPLLSPPSRSVGRAPLRSAPAARIYTLAYIPSTSARIRPACILLYVQEGTMIFFACTYASMISLIGTGSPCPQSAALPSGYFVCPDCGTCVPIKSHCGSWDCSACWRIPAARAVRSITDRFGDQISNMQHWVLSPPPGWFRSKEPVEMYEAVARFIRREMPEMAGVAILHPYRVRERPDDISVVRPRRILRHATHHISGLEIDIEDVEFDAVSIVEGAEVYHGTWAALRERSDWQDFVYWSPHIHFIAAGYMLSLTQQRLRARGWIIKRVRRMKDEVDISKVLMYLWSHAAYAGRKKKQYRVCIGRFWHIRRLHIIFRDEYVSCPCCGGYMRRVDSEYHGWVADLPPATVRRRCVVWRLELR